MSVTLPGATGGEGALTYKLTPKPPDGVTFDPLSRLLSGKPTATQSAVTYTYTAADSDDDTSAGDTDTQTFTIEVVEPEGPDPDPDPNTPPVFSGKVPALKWTKDKAVSVTLPGATGGEGALTYKLTPKPPDGVTFNQSTRLLSGKPTATQAATTYAYTASDADEDTSAGDTATQSFTIKVAEPPGPDAAPVFGESAPDLHWFKGQSTGSVVLPPATGGNGDLTYRLAPRPPDGVTFDPLTRTLAGTPTGAQGAVTYTYTASDADANTATSDEATLSFEITVYAEDTAPAFTKQAEDLVWEKDQPTGAVVLPDAAGGNGDLTYKLTPEPPAGVTFDPLTRTLAGAPTGTQDAVTYTWTASDADGNTAASDVATQSFTITVVERDTAPAFTEQAPDQVWAKGETIGSVVLPVATGGNGDLTYALSPEPPEGVTFDPATRTLSGAPTVKQAAETYTYTATDSDDNTDASDAATQSFTIAVKGPHFVVSETQLSIVEEGEPATFTVRLGTRPSADVWVTAHQGGAESMETRPWRLTFTPDNYGEPKQVAVHGVHDPGFEDEDATVFISGQRGGYDRVKARVAVKVTDDDTDIVPTIDPIPDQEWLVGQAIEPLVLPVTIYGNRPMKYSLSPDPPDGVSYHRPGYELAQRLSGVPTTPQEATTYTFTVTDSDENESDEDSATAEFTIAVRQPALVLSEASLALQEGGVDGTFTVRLAARPTSDVTVTLASADADAVTASPPSLTFTTATYATARTVTVTAVQDDDPDDETVDITLSASGGGYDGETPTVAVTVDDDETDTAPSFDGQAPDREWTADRPITTVTLPEATGGNGELTYSLSPDPPEGVVFDPGTRTLAGTPKSPRETTEYTYKATDADRNTADGDAASQTFTITVKRVALVLSTTRLELKEGETDQTLTVKLGSPPTEDVTVSLAMDREIVTTDPRQLIFTPANHATPRTVTAKGAQDEDFDDETTEITLTAAGGGYDGETATVDVTVDDDETDTAPAFDVEMDDIEWVANRAFEPFALPEASGGNGKLTYTLSPEPPASVTFDPATRTLSGTPTATQAPTLYTWTATDADGNTGAADTATLTFTIEVRLEGLDDAAFVSSTGVPEVMLAGDKATVTVRMRNTGPTTWRSASYRLGSQRPRDNEIWGLARVALPADVAPDETVDLTFAITAPKEVGAHKFRWRMVRGASGWFGGKTELLTIAVEDPSFLGREIADQMWVKGETVVSLTLPEARGNGGALTYSLKPAPPDGVTFTEATRVLAGTPEAVQEATEYRYVATDAGGGKAKLTFEIAVEEGVIDDAAVASVTGLPSKMAAGGTATVTVTMTNTGTTTWSSPAGYNLGSWDRSDKDRWGVRRAAAPGTVAPNETADFTFDVTAPDTPGVHPFTWRMVRDPGGWFGAHTADVSVTVEDPSFGDETVPDQTWMQGEEVDALVLPAAAGTAGPFSYAISPELPDGVTFAESTRTVSGTPEAARAATRYSYTATDTDGGMATLSFRITVEALAMDDAAFVSQTAVPEKMAAGAEAAVTVRMKNTGTTTWTKAAGYALGSQRPDDNDRWGFKRVSPPADVAPDATVDFTFTITAPTAGSGGRRNS